jgi:ribokinase
MFNLKNPKYDMITIGDPVIDSFLFIHDIEIKIINGVKKAIINWGDKLPVDKFYKSVAGNGANNAIGSARLGLKTSLFCVIAHDSGGREIVHKMRKEKVSVEYIVVDDRHGTNYHTALSYKGERTIFVFHEHRHYVLPKLAPSKWVYLTSMPQGFRAIYPDLAAYLDRDKVKLGFNPGTFQLRKGPKANKSMLQRTEVLSVNKEEAQSWVGNIKDIEEICKRLRKLGPKAIALTDGRKGAYSYSDEGFFYIPEFPGPRVEATGAGDAFTTAYIAALVYGKTHKEALRWGPVNAGSVVLKVGPLDGLLSHAQIEAHLSRMKHYHPIAITTAKIKARVAKIVAKKKD